MRMRVLRVKNENETVEFSRMMVRLRLRVLVLYDLALKSFLMKHQNCNEMFENLPLKSTKFNLDFSNF